MASRIKGRSSILRSVALRALGADLPVFAHLPLVLQPIFGSPLMIGTTAAIVLNLIMRIGIRQRETTRIELGARYREAVEEFLTEQGGRWAARREVVAPMHRLRRSKWRASMPDSPSSVVVRRGPARCPDRVNPIRRLGSCFRGPKPDIRAPAWGGERPATGGSSPSG